jgi:hypothetical protein
MIGNQHEIISMFGKLPAPYFWSFMNACSVVGKKEHGVRQGMYREMIGALGWEKLHYAQRKELINFMTNKDVVNENIAFMERMDRNFKTKTNSLIMFDNYYRNFVKPV